MDEPVADPGRDSEFATGLDPDTQRFGESKPPARSCQWCGASLGDEDPDRCPSCGAPLKPVDEDLDIPGVTGLSPGARDAALRAEAKRVRAAASRGTNDEAAARAERDRLGLGPDVGGVSPPDPEVRDQMRRLEREAREAAAAADAAAQAAEEAAARVAAAQTAADDAATRAAAGAAETQARTGADEERRDA